MHVDDVGWSTRARNGLRYSNYFGGKVIYEEILTLEELASLTEREVLGRPNVGKVVLSEYEEILAEHGLAFRDRKALRSADPHPWFGFCL